MGRAIILTMLLATPALAKDFPVTDQDQAAVLTVCETAARSTALIIEVNAQIAAWCVQWKGKMQAANAPSAAPQKPEAER